ncbi:MAG: glycosyltransferase, partial [Candidatus Omnitrophica bacterium]|nr:glycosyltransferase [Candidatus Omnitrophota bacterium]
KLYYVRMHENTGSSGGFHEGVKRAYEKGYDWFWLMDDDAEPKEDALEKLLNWREFDNETLALSCLKVDDQGKIQWQHSGWEEVKKINHNMIKPISENDLKKGVLEVDFSSFVGFLISKRAIQQIGFPRKEFFIHHDDVEYSFRIRDIGKILLVSDSIIKHKYESIKSYNPRVIKILFLRKKLYEPPYSSLWLSYYGFRNSVFLKKKYASFIEAFLFGSVVLVKMIVKIILTNSEFKGRCLRFYFNAFVDGLRGNFDNEKPKKILYNDL